MLANAIEFFNDYMFAAFFGIVAAILFYIPFAARAAFPIRQAVYTVMIGDAVMVVSALIPKIMGLWSSAPIDTGYSSKMPLLDGLLASVPAFTILLIVLLVIARLVAGALRPVVAKV